MKKIKFISLTAAVAAMIFTFSCTSGGSSEEGNPSGSAGDDSSSSSSEVDPSGVGGDNSSSSSSEIEQSSSSLVLHGDLIDNRSGIPQTYKTVIIGNQTWMARNLNFEGYANQSRIWGDLYYDETDRDFSQYAETHGRLYSWAEVASVYYLPCPAVVGANCVGVMQICPTGWHLPSKAEWDELINFVGGRETAGKLLKAAEGWTPLCNFEDDKSTDDYGFTALPGGRLPKFTCPPDVDCAMPMCGFATYRNFGTSAWWWTATRYEGSDDKAHCINMLGGSDSIDYSACNITEDKLSVRCVKD